GRLAATVTTGRGGPIGAPVPWRLSMARAGCCWTLTGGCRWGRSLRSTQRPRRIRRSTTRCARTGETARFLTRTASRGLCCVCWAVGRMSELETTTDEVRRTVDEAIEAGAQALSHHWRDMHTGGSLDRQRDLAGHSIRAAWPVLSAGL